MRVSTSQQLINKIKLIQQTSSKVFISYDTLTAETIQIKIRPFCDFECGIDISDLLELANHPGEVQINNNELHYSYAPLPDISARIHKTIPLIDVPNSFPTGKPNLSIRIPHIPILTDDNAILSFGVNKLIIHSKGYITTRACVLAERIEGCKPVSCLVRSKSLNIVNKMEGERILSFYDNYIVAYGIEPESTTAILIHQLNES